MGRIGWLLVVLVTSLLWTRTSDSQVREKRLSKSRDWPQWRGARRDGVSTETGLLDNWGVQGPPLRWQVKGLGIGYSTVAVVGGRIFTMGARGAKAFLICLDEKNGKEIWSTPVGTGRPNSTPTVEGDLVFALGRHGNLIAANRLTGQLVWRTHLVKAFGGVDSVKVGFSESVLVDGSHVICTPGGKDATLVALNRQTGKEIWRAALPKDVGKKGRDGSAYSSIVVSQACGVRQYIQFVGRGLISVRADNGRVLWTYNRIANWGANVSTPIVQADTVFASSAYSTGAVLLKLTRHGNGVRPKPVYFLPHKVLQNHHGGMVHINGHIYAGHGHNKGFPVCIEMKSGKVAWRPGRGPGSGSAAVLYADGHLYFRYENGVMALIEANPKRYRLKGKFKIPSDLGKSWAHPVIAGGRLYLRDEDVLLCYDVRK